MATGLGGPLNGGAASIRPGTGPEQQARKSLDDEEDCVPVASPGCIVGRADAARRDAGLGPSGRPDHRTNEEPPVAPRRGMGVGSFS